jgi:hypothetical protein
MIAYNYGIFLQPCFLSSSNIASKNKRKNCNKEQPSLTIAVHCTRYELKYIFNNVIFIAFLNGKLFPRKYKIILLKIFSFR